MGPTDLPPRMLREPPRLPRLVGAEPRMHRAPRFLLASRDRCICVSRMGLRFLARRREGCASRSPATPLGGRMRSSGRVSGVCRARCPSFTSVVPLCGSRAHSVGGAFAVPVCGIRACSLVGGSRAHSLGGVLAMLRSALYAGDVGSCALLASCGSSSAACSEPCSVSSAACSEPCAGGPGNDALRTGRCTLRFGGSGGHQLPPA